MSILTEYHKSVEKATGLRFAADGQAAINRIGAAVEEFVIQNGLGRTREIDQFMTMEAMSEFTPDQFIDRVGLEKVKGLVESAGIHEDKDPKSFRCACESVCNAFEAMLGKQPGTVWGRQSMKQTNYAQNAIKMGLESYMPQAYAEAMRAEKSPKATLEGFGVDVDKVVPDLKISITVSLMRFHRAVLPSLIPNRGTDSPNVMYTKPTVLLYQLDDVTAAPVPLINMYRDAALITNDLKPIIPLAVHEADIKNEREKTLLADNVIKNGVHTNIIRLSVDENKFGNQHVGYTDLVAEKVRVDKIFFQIDTTKITDAEGAVQDNDDTYKGTGTFMSVLPSFAGELSRVTNGLDSSERNAIFPHFHRLSGSSLEVDDEFKEEDPTEIHLFDSLESGDQIQINFRVSASIVLKTGDVYGDITAVAKAVNQTGKPTAAAEKLANAINTSGIKVLGYSLDAKHSEEDLKRSNIAVRTTFQPFSYDIPTGRNYLYDWPLGVQQEEISTQLADIIAIGQDDRGIKIIKKSMDEVAASVAAEKIGAWDNPNKTAAKFVSGSKVNPYIWQGTLNVAELQSIRSADRPGDVSQFAQTFLTRVIERMLTFSFWDHELGPNKVPTFNLLTSQSVLSNVLGMPHIHNHLDKRESDNVYKVPYRIVLQNGAILNCYVHTFAMVQDEIMIIPSVSDDDTSYLNFGHNWDYGTVVGQFTYTGDAIFNRIYANCRELPIVTCPVGAQISVTGIPVITRAVDDFESELPNLNPTYTKLV